MRHLIDHKKPSAALCGTSWDKKTNAVFDIMHVDCYWCKKKYEESKNDTNNR